MAKKRRTRSGLSRIAENYAISLISEATLGKISRGNTASVEGAEPVENPIPFRDRRALLDSVTKLLTGQPNAPAEDSESGLDDFRKRLEDDGGTASDGDSGSDGSA